MSHLILLRSPTRAVAALAIPALLLPTPPAATHATRGIVYTFTVTTQSGGARGRDITMSGKGQVAGGRARIDFTDISAPELRQQGTAYGKDSYILVDGGGQTFTIVDTKEKKYYPMDVNSLMQGLNAVGGMLKMEISDISIDAERIQPDTTVDSYKTQHWRLTQRYTMKMSVMGMNSTSKTESVGDYYFALEFQDVVNPFLSAGGTGGILFNSPEYTEKLRAAQQKMHNGVPVLAIMRHTSTDSKGNTHTSTSTARVTGLTRADIPAATFETPAGYTKVEQTQPVARATPAEGRGVSPTAAGADSSATAADSSGGLGGAAKEAAKEAGKETAKQKIKKKFHIP